MPCWLNTFEEALGRYYPFFEGKNWDEVIMMDNQDLINAGIQDESLRKMMIKGFEKQKKILVSRISIYPYNIHIFRSYKRKDIFYLLVFFPNILFYYQINLLGGIIEQPPPPAPAPAPVAATATPAKTETAKKASGKAARERRRRKRAGKNKKAKSDAGVTGETNATGTTEKKENSV